MTEPSLPGESRSLLTAERLRSGRARPPPPTHPSFHPPPAQEGGGCSASTPSLPGEPRGAAGQEQEQEQERQRARTGCAFAPPALSSIGDAASAAGTSIPIPMAEVSPWLSPSRDTGAGEVSVQDSAASSGAAAAAGDARCGSREAPGEPAQVEGEQLLAAGAGKGREKVEKRAGTGGEVAASAAPAHPVRG